MDNNTEPSPRDLIEALIAHLSEGSSDVEWGIADRDYILMWHEDVAGPGIEATIYDETGREDVQVATVRVTFEVTS